MSRRRGNTMMDETSACVAVIVLIMLMLATLFYIPGPQRVRERGWTREQIEEKNKPASEKIGRAVGRFGVGFGRGVVEGVTK